MLNRRNSSGGSGSAVLRQLSAVLHRVEQAWFHRCAVGGPPTGAAGRAVAEGGVTQLWAWSAEAIHKRALDVLPPLPLRAPHPAAPSARAALS